MSAFGRKRIYVRNTQRRFTMQTNSKVIKFNKDKRSYLTSLIRVVAIIVALSITSVWIALFQDDISFNNIKRVAAYAAAAAAGDTDFQSFSFDPGINTSCYPFDFGLLVISSDSYRFVSGFDTGGFTAHLHYASPAAAISDKRVLVYDRGSREYTLANSYSVLNSNTVDGDILSASMNKSGDFCIVTNESGYRGGASLYNKRGELKFKWQTPDYYTMLSSVAPSGNAFAVYTMTDRSGAFEGTLFGFETSNPDTPVYIISTGGKKVYSISHFKNGNLILICDDGLHIYSSSGDLLATMQYPSPLSMYEVREEEMPLLVFKDTSQSGIGMLVVLPDQSGGIAFSWSFSENIRDIAYTEKSIYVLSGSTITALDYLSAVPEAKEVTDSSVRSLIASDKSGCIAIYSDRAEKKVFQ